MVLLHKTVDSKKSDTSNNQLQIIIHNTCFTDRIQEGSLKVWIALKAGNLFDRTVFTLTHVYIVGELGKFRKLVICFSLLNLLRDNNNNNNNNNNNKYTAY